jgi:hypothetical protein
MPRNIMRRLKWAVAEKRLAARCYNPEIACGTKLSEIDALPDNDCFDFAK